ncbi:ScbA/BarX family gamma-butyrolactone biosynthesis protein [Streptomyces xanthochromogenes]|uniref:ScbA/BarX family gamma-butyrolactone biosynthesis protein n=1 Tax=Streptomyces xanthochromogenes TaxID=67384 RepID=UPI00343C0D25
MVKTPAQHTISGGGRKSRPATMALLHRSRTEDAFAVGWNQRGEGYFTVQARLPSDHPFFTPTPQGTYDPLLLVEVMRQSSILVSHAGLGVPLDYHFMLSDLEFACRPEYLAIHAGPDDVEIDVLLPEISRYTSGKPSRLTCHWIMRRAGWTVATGVGRTRFTSPQVYQRLRMGRQTAVACAPSATPLPEHHVGRTRAEDVLLCPADEPNTWQLSVDTTHPTLFQRPNDHVPGMVLFEAARQAAAATLGPERCIPSSGAVSFRRYAEFGEPFQLRTAVRGSAQRGERTEVRVLGLQSGRQVFDCTFVIPAR